MMHDFMRQEMADDGWTIITYVPGVGVRPCERNMPSGRLQRTGLLVSLHTITRGNKDTFCNMGSSTRCS